MDVVAGLPQPLGKGAFGESIRHLGHNYVCRRSSIPVKPCANGGVESKQTL